MAPAAPFSTGSGTICGAIPVKIMTVDVENMNTAAILTAYTFTMM
jgi:hypothetical protein